MTDDNFWVECNACKAQLKNWSGSTPCCGSIAFILEKDGKAGSRTSLYASINGSEIKPAVMDFSDKPRFPTKKDLAVELIARFSGNSRGNSIAKKAFIDCYHWLEEKWPEFNKQDK